MNSNQLAIFERKLDAKCFDSTDIEDIFTFVQSPPRAEAEKSWTNGKPSSNHFDGTAADFYRMRSLGFLVEEVDLIFAAYNEALAESTTEKD